MEQLLWPRASSGTHYHNPTHICSLPLPHVHVPFPAHLLAAFLDGNNSCKQHPGQWRKGYEHDAGNERLMRRTGGKGALGHCLCKSSQIWTWHWLYGWCFRNIFKSLLILCITPTTMGIVTYMHMKPDNSFPSLLSTEAHYKNCSLDQGYSLIPLGHYWNIKINVIWQHIAFFVFGQGIIVNMIRCLI